MGFFDKRSGGRAAEWEWVDLGKIEAADLKKKMEEAMDPIAGARGRKIGAINYINDPGGFLGKTDEEIQDMAQSSVLKASNQLTDADQRAIARGDVCIVVAHIWVRSKQGNAAWMKIEGNAALMKIVGVVLLH